MVIGLDVVLADGTSVSADLVVSGLGVTQTVLRLLSAREIDERLRHRIRNIHYDLKMIEFNGASPLPREIRALLEQR